MIEGWEGSGGEQLDKFCFEGFRDAGDLSDASACGDRVERFGIGSDSVGYFPVASCPGVILA